jgi:hypothetical protein
LTFKTILKNENSLPVHHTIGNHDIWGWFIKENRPEDDPQYGKAWVVDTFEMKTVTIALPNRNGILLFWTVHNSIRREDTLPGLMNHNLNGLQKN